MVTLKNCNIVCTILDKFFEYADSQNSVGQLIRPVCYISTMQCISYLFIKIAQTK